ncbi:hypothetical protein AcW1_007982 [Taiwanofungus camphoratus]|nr:hypothetical protein AcW1_007982 [Antrodia cinnamomea]
MFKSILSSRRIPSADFQMLTGPAESALTGKENYPGVPSSSEDTKAMRSEKQRKRKAKDQSTEGYVTSEAFEKLLDDMQIPSELRPKLATMDTGVKAAFLKSSKEITISMSHVSPPLTPRGLRRAHSIESLSSPRPHTKQSQENHDLSKSSNSPPFPTATHTRGVSVGASQPSLLFSSEPSQTKPSKEKRSKMATITPAKYVNILTSTSTTQLEIETVKKLRLLLRNEAASWTQEFLRQGGYTALLTRLNEILQVEWREEQHDDQILHELLRCFKALSTSVDGCAALRSYCPSPFNQLVALLYSDKKPGEVGTRQLILELLYALFDLYPSSSLPSVGSPTVHHHTRSRSVPWEEGTTSSSSNLVTLPAPHSTVFSLVRTLLLTPAPPPAEDPGPSVEPHAFIEELHRPRIYKTYMQELSDLCRDYFWVFCHPNNPIWVLEETDEAKVEKPRAPGGMTGGVEFEAMTYMTTHFKFINLAAKAAQNLNLPKEHEHSAYQFHNDMFLSGIERVLVMARKASTTYYPTLHLEIARYVNAAGRAGFELPWGVSRLIGAPPSSMRKSVARGTGSQAYGHLGRGSTSAPGSPTKRPTVSTAHMPVLPGLPSPRKVTPIFGL